MKKIVKVSSPIALQRTIETDEQVAFWFAYLLVRPEVAEFLGRDPAVVRDYDEIRKMELSEKSLLTVGVGLLCWTLVLKSLWPALGIVLLFLVSMKVLIRKRQAVARLGSILIAKEFTPEALPHSTLYQVCEKLSRQYRIPSLVDVIYHSDVAMRYGILTVDILLIMIWPVFALWQWFLFLSVAYHVLSALTRTEVFLRRVVARKSNAE